MTVLFTLFRFSFEQIFVQYTKTELEEKKSREDFSVANEKEMSRTFAKLELSVTQNGNKIKTFTEDVTADEKDVSGLLNALQKTKDSSNEFLTTLVEQDKLNKPGGVAISHSKRKYIDEGNILL